MDVCRSLNPPQCIYHSPESWSLYPKVLIIPIYTPVNSQNVYVPNQVRVKEVGSTEVLIENLNLGNRT